MMASHTGDNTSMGFREHEAVRGRAYRDDSRLFRSEVRANPIVEEPVELVLTIADLPPGSYRLITYHHCHSGTLEPADLRMTVEGASGTYPHLCARPKGQNVTRSGGGNTCWGGVVTDPVRVRFSSATTGVVLNGFELAVDMEGSPRRRPPVRRGEDCREGR